VRAHCCPLLPVTQVGPSELLPFSLSVAGKGVILLNLAHQDKATTAFHKYMHGLLVREQELKANHD